MNIQESKQEEAAASRLAGVMLVLLFGLPLTLHAIGYFLA
jgi:hypothetical protein